MFFLIQQEFHSSKKELDIPLRKPWPPSHKKEGKPTDIDLQERHHTMNAASMKHLRRRLKLEGLMKKKKIFPNGAYLL